MQESLNHNMRRLEKNGCDRRAIPFLRSGSPGSVISRGYGRGLIFKGLANLFLVAMAYSARSSRGANP